MTQYLAVPRLDLAPKLRRPLSLWNPLDYMRLLHWVFFFPQALRWYTVWYTQNLPEEFFIPKNLNWKNAWGLLPNKIIGKLFLQGLILAIILALGQVFILQKIGFTLNYLYVLAGISLIFIGYFFLYLFYISNYSKSDINDYYYIYIKFLKNWINWGLPLFIILSITFNLFYSISSLPYKEQFSNILIILIFSILRFIWLSISIQTVFIVLVDVANIESFFITSIFLFVFITNNFMFIFKNISVEFGLLKSTLVTLLSGIISILVVCFIFLRPDDWLLSLFRKQNLCNDNRGQQFPHVTLIPFPYLSEQLKIWLHYNWEEGAINAKKLFSYTFQFIPIIKALNQVLAETDLDQVVYRVAQLAEPPYNWELIRCLCGYLFPLWYRLDTPTAATAAGFWFLYQKNLRESTKAFITVRSLNYGSEMYILTQTLFNFDRAKNLNNIATLQIPNFPIERLLRPKTWKAIASLRRVAEDIKVIRDSSSRSARAFALSRAIGELKSLRDKYYILPELERELINKIAINWSVALMDVASEVGQVRITQRVVNPYVVGDPVQGNLFIGREDVIRQLEELWMMGNQIHSVVLYGHRRMGKTSILVNAVNCLGLQIQLAYVNLLRLGDSPQGVGEVLMAICDEISQTVKLPPPTDADLLSLPYRTFERYLKQVEAKLDGGLIIALDEFEKIEDLIEAKKIPIDFMGFLRGLVQMSSKIAFAFAGLHTLEEMTADYFQPFFASVIPIHVGFQERAATRQILANPGNEDFPLDYTLEALDEISALTHGQPYLVQLVGFQLVRRYNDFVFEQGRSRDPVFTVEDVEAVINDPEFFKRGRYYFDGVWGQAARGAEGQQAIVQVLAPHPEGLSLDALAQSTGMNDANLQEALNTLKRHDVVEETQGSWRIMVELFRRWVLQQ
ncbi:helix-turn-helix domain-containing protein [Nostoc sp. PA-18-2419]|uniref:helix-turn-helix domain-containing protein n=1 Tax=Nostoc sp. PA-18-2419 TaxID=2575443 RepID=UPI001107ED63|nr:helix-turn-helix domain-containing protein [Nostoc sp. PA-18-2419]